MPTKRATRILCFGDSNTWGYIPGSGGRYPADVRWSGRLAEELQSRGRNVIVIEDGLNGRTTKYTALLRPGTNASKSLAKVLQKHDPLEVVVLALGVNDLKKGNASDAQEAADGISLLVDICRKHLPQATILIISPPEISDSLENETFADAAQKSQLLPQACSRLAQDKKTLHLPCSKLFSASSLDGIHYSQESHKLLALSLAKMLDSFCEQQDSLN